MIKICETKRIKSRKQIDKKSTVRYYLDIKLFRYKVIYIIKIVLNIITHLRIHLRILDI